MICRTRAELGLGPAPEGLNIIAQGFNPGLVAHVGRALPVRRSFALSSEGEKVAPDCAWPMRVVHDPKRNRPQRLCRPFRANLTGATNPGLKPWAIVYSRFAASLKPNPACL